MDINYCDSVCPKGKEMLAMLLAKNNSAYDTLIDFRCFAENCIKTCQHKDIAQENLDISETQEG